DTIKDTGSNQLRNCRKCFEEVSVGPADVFMPCIRSLSGISYGYFQYHNLGGEVLARAARAGSLSFPHTLWVLHHNYTAGTSKQVRESSRQRRSIRATMPA